MTGDGTVQLSFFEVGDPVLAEVRAHLTNIDVNTLTPIEALNILSELQKTIA
jgi:DNA mismatch repair protein MutS